MNAGRSRIKIITVSSNTKNYGFLNYLKPSCCRHALDLLVLEYEDSFFSNRIKDALLSQYLSEIHDDDIVFFTDADDTAFLSGEELILEKFLNFKMPLIFSAEINCWPDSTFQKDYLASESCFKYLNSGAFIGHAGILKYIYNKYPIFTTAMGRYSWSNQHYWNYVFLKETVLLKLDYSCDLFYNTAFPLNEKINFKRDLRSDKKIASFVLDEKSRLEKEVNLDGQNLTIELTGSAPCHVHFPGPISKILLNNDYFKKWLS